MKKTEKKITQGEKVMAIAICVLIVLSGISLYLFFAERAKSKVVEAGDGIAQAVFTRTGAIVELSDTENVKNLEVYDDSDTMIVDKKVGSDAKVILADFDW